jgi:hypothetical protein
MPIARAASRIVAPSRTVTSVPLTVRVGMREFGRSSGERPSLYIDRDTGRSTSTIIVTLALSAQSF